MSAASEASSTTVPAPVNVTVDPPAAVQQLPAVSMTPDSTFVVWDDDTTRAGRMMGEEPIARQFALDTTTSRERFLCGG